MNNFTKVKTEGGSDFFRELEKTPVFQNMEKLVQKSLEDQWNDLILSGVIQILFKDYPKYFFKPRGTKVKFKKAIDPEDVRSERDLRALAQDNFQEDKISVPATALKMGALLLFLGRETKSKVKTIGSYNNFRSDMKRSLKTMANKGGQSILDSIEMPKPLRFRLSKRDLVKQINTRVDKLITGLDATTKKRFVSQLAIGIRNGETKGMMIQRMQREGLKISQKRMRTIVTTETVAVSEWMRQQTAMLNGSTRKVWVTAMDEKVCPICAPLHGTVLGIKNNFGIDIPATDTRKAIGFKGQIPPAHVSCRCSVEYELNPCSDYIKSANVFDRIGELFKKSAPDYKVEGNMSKCFNPNAVWAGGESLVGKDKGVGEVYGDLKVLPREIRDVLLSDLRSSFSDEGYVQLRLKLGLTGKISPKE